MPATMDIKYNHMPTRIKWGAVLGRDSATKAGKARMSSMTQEELTQFQSKAAKARWKKEKENNGLRSPQRPELSAYARLGKPIPFGI